MSNCHCTPQREKSIAFTLDVRLVYLEVYAKIEKGGGGGGGGKKGYHSQRICGSRRDLKVDEAKKCPTL